MDEPTGLIAFFTTLSSIFVTVLGVDYRAIFWGMVGASLATLYGEPMGRVKAVLSVFLSALVGAAVGTAITEKWNSVPWLVVGSLVCASGARVVVGALLKGFIRNIERFFGK